jgi:hypothetical protein
MDTDGKKRLCFHESDYHRTVTASLSPCLSENPTTQSSKLFQIWVAEETGCELIEARFAGAQSPKLSPVFDAYRDRVFSVALRYSGNHAAARYIAQYTFVKRFDSIADFSGDASFETGAIARWPTGA